MKSANGRRAAAALVAGIAGTAVMAGAAGAHSHAAPRVKESVIRLPGAIKNQPLQMAAGPGKSRDEWVALSPVITVTKSGFERIHGVYSLISAPAGRGAARKLASGRSLTVASDLGGVASLVRTRGGELWYEGGIYRLSSAGKPKLASSKPVDGGVGIVIGPDGDLYTTDDGLQTGKCLVKRNPIKCTTIAWPASLQKYIGAGGPDALASAGGRLWEVTQAGDLFSMTTAGRYAGPFDAGTIVADPGNAIVGSGKYLYAAASAKADASVGGSRIDRIAAGSPSSKPKTYGTAAGMPRHALVSALTVAAGGNVWFTDIGTGKVGELNVRSGKIKEYSLPHGYAFGKVSRMDESVIAAGPDGTVFVSAYSSATGLPALVRFSQLRR